MLAISSWGGEGVVWTSKATTAEKSAAGTLEAGTPDAETTAAGTKEAGTPAAGTQRR
jgi:hypothetical protein